MIAGFILDVRFDKLTGRMISWIVDEDGVTHRFKIRGLALFTCERHRLVVLKHCSVLNTKTPSQSNPVDLSNIL